MSREEKREDGLKRKKNIHTKRENEEKRKNATHAASYETKSMKREKEVERTR